MSDEQVGRAAAEGAQVTFRFLLGPGRTYDVRGYVVAMDDFKVLVVAPEEDGTISKTLVHKTASVIIIDPHPTLDLLPEPVQQAVSEIGAAFWDWCRRKYLPPPKSQGELS